MTTARSSHNEAEHREEPESGSHRVVPSRPTEQRDKASVHRYLERYAAAATNGDARAMIELWGVPAFVVGRSEAGVVESEEQDRVVATVRWPYLNERDEEVGEEAASTRRLRAPLTAPSDAAETKMIPASKCPTGAASRRIVAHARSIGNSSETRAVEAM
jgi:hypothetical protein